MNTENRAYSLHLFMERVTRTLELIELKAPALILADGMMRVKESATLLERDFTKPGWGEVIGDAHDKFLAYKESLKEGEEDV